MAAQQPSWPSVSRMSLLELAAAEAVEDAERRQERERRQQLEDERRRQQEARRREEEAAAALEAAAAAAVEKAGRLEALQVGDGSVAPALLWLQFCCHWLHLL